MKTTTLILAAMTLWTGLAAAESSFTGTWKGTRNGLPAVTLIVRDSAGTISGTIEFFLQVRDSESSPWHVDAGDTEVLLSPVVHNKVLSFEVRHHVCHNCTEYGPNVPVKVELQPDGTAKLGDIVLRHEQR